MDVLRFSNRIFEFVFSSCSARTVGHVSVPRRPEPIARTYELIFGMCTLVNPVGTSFGTFHDFPDSPSSPPCPDNNDGQRDSEKKKKTGLSSKYRNVNIRTSLTVFRVRRFTVDFEIRNQNQSPFHLRTGPSPPPHTHTPRARAPFHFEARGYAYTVVKETP